MKNRFGIILVIYSICSLIIFAGCFTTSSDDDDDDDNDISADDDDDTASDCPDIDGVWRIETSTCSADSVGLDYEMKQTGCEYSSATTDGAYPGSGTVGADGAVTWQSDDPNSDIPDCSGTLAADNKSLTMTCRDCSETLKLIGCDYTTFAQCYEENCYDVQVAANACGEECKTNGGEMTCFSGCAAQPIACMAEHCSSGCAECVETVWECNESCGALSDSEGCINGCSNDLAECGNTTVDTLNQIFEDQQTWQ